MSITGIYFAGSVLPFLMIHSSKFVAAWVGLLFLVSLAGAVPAVSQVGERASELTPAEMLEDGVDAMTDHAPGAARNLLEELVSSYPASPEAAKARKLLAKLEGPPESAYERDVIRQDEVERLRGFRRAFLLDAGDRVFFSESSAALGGRANFVIANQARWLVARPSLRIDVIGRSDDGGSRQQELELAQKRAEAVRDRLVASGVEAARLRIRALGSSSPVALCTTPLCKAENRTTELFISALDDDTPDIASDGTPPGKGADLGSAQAGLGDITSR